MDPSLAPSFEGFISKLLSALFAILAAMGIGSMLIGKFWSILHFYYDPEGKSGIHKGLEAFFIALGQRWRTSALLLLAFAIATITPIYESTSIKRQVVNELCRDGSAEFKKAVCEGDAIKYIPSYNLNSFFEARYVDIFQTGLWLLTIFAAGLASNLIISSAKKTTDTRTRVILVSIFFSIFLFVTGHLQDYLGR